MSAHVATKTSQPVRSQFAPTTNGLLQRKCACGGSAGLDDMCEGCRDKRLSSPRRTSNFNEPDRVPTMGHEAMRSPGQMRDEAMQTSIPPRFGHDFSKINIYPPAPAIVQPKLEINQPGDVYEQEADHMAEMVMRMPDSRASNVDLSPSSVMLQRKCACGGNAGSEGECEACRSKRLQRRASGHDELTSVPPIVHEVLHSHGQPLDAKTRASFEPRFGHDFSKVRVHADTRATESAQAVNALAYTVGQNLVFGEGQYAPSSSAGQQLLAHELTHVVQQRFDLSSACNGIAIGPANDAMEKQASRKALSVGGSFDNSPENILNSPKVALQRQKKPPPPNTKDPNKKDPIIKPPPNTRDHKTMEDWAIEINNTKGISGWTKKLPDCPCTDQAARSDTKNWEGGDSGPLAMGCSTLFEPDAKSGYRSAKVFASKAGTKHGQQCCYDKNGQLITSGDSAGTPDLWSPVTDMVNHGIFDVVPFSVLGPSTYNIYWIPNQGKGCKASKADLPKPPGKK